MLSIGRTFFGRAFIKIVKQTTAVILDIVKFTYKIFFISIDKKACF